MLEGAQLQPEPGQGRGCNPSLVRRGGGQRSSLGWLGRGPAGLLRWPQRQYSCSMLAISSSSE